MSFLKTGIANLLDGSKEFMFSGYGFKEYEPDITLDNKFLENI